MLMDAYIREGGVKNPKNHAYVIYGCPLIGLSFEVYNSFLPLEMVSKQSSKSKKKCP